MNTYRNYQGDIGFTFDYASDKELRANFEALVFELLDVLDNYNLADETVEELNYSTTYFVGENFRAYNLAGKNEDEFLETGKIVDED